MVRSQFAKRFTKRFSTAFGRRYAPMVLGMGATAATTVTIAVAYEKPTPKMPVPAPATSPAQLPEISLEEVKKHIKEDSVWVTYDGLVYDVTGFVTNHPGGKELLLTAAGLDLGHFFENYPVHGKTAKAADYLSGMCIGRLSEADAKKAKLGTNSNVHVEHRMNILADARKRLLLVICTIPLWMALRIFVRVVGLLLPPLAHGLAKLLPVSVPGYGGARAIKAYKKNGTRSRIAVIGGGIAGCGAAYALEKSGFDVTVYEGRKVLGGNAHTFDWDVKGKNVKTCVSVTAWPPTLYKQYVQLLKQLDVKTSPIHLSWVLNSKVPGDEGYLWAADPSAPNGSLRKHFAKDFARYETVVKWIDRITTLLSFQIGQEPSMYSIQSGLGVLNPLTTFPLHHLCRLAGISQNWWDVVFTPHYTASFLTDKLDNMVAVSAPLIEKNIPLLPNSDNQENSVLNTCETWADAGVGIREVFDKLTTRCNVKTDTRVLKVNELRNEQLEVVDEAGGVEQYDRVVFACACNAVGNMIHEHNYIEDAILASPEYADDHHPSTGHMHAVMHNDASIIPAEHRDDILRRGSNYVEITKLADGSINIENTYNFSVQTPSLVGLPLEEKTPLLITHALGEGKSIDPKLVCGEGNHARAHPLYSGWNVASLLSLRLIQGRRGVYYCGNYTTPGNCHDMSLNSGLNVAHSIGAAYPFEGHNEAMKDFFRLRTLMGL